MPVLCKMLQIADDDFEILSAIKPDDVDAGDDVNTLSFVLEPTTVVTFIAHRYSLAFVLDLSSSLSSLVIVCELFSSDYELSSLICDSSILCE